MKKLVKDYGRFLALLVAISIGLTLTLLQRKVVVADVNLLPALPTALELPGFTRLKVWPTPTGKYLSATRRTDRMLLTVSIIVMTSEAEARQKVKEVVLTTVGPGAMPKGSPTGRKIGQEVWQSHRGAGEPSGSFQLSTLDGRSIVVVQAMVPSIGRDANGKIIQNKISTSDLKFLEDLAIVRLNKLSKMGPTH